ncbi:myelin and lymphocyte protein [Erinaceus europaeus]|uniref:Myelin and lymphocyte protein n=1 Tax=Erinaceus europaeus TaxID=9365 RepID=A0ABM3X6H5_ERIEU|nr:myelin and lymphocyte protein [Erinaceus europaeus]
MNMRKKLTCEKQQIIVKEIMIAHRICEKEESRLCQTWVDSLLSESRLKDLEASEKRDVYQRDGFLNATTKGFTLKAPLFQALNSCSVGLYLWSFYCLDSLSSLPPSLPLQIFGGLVWILIASSRVPIPLIQGWVMFVSVFCFLATTTLLVLYIIGAHGGETSWITLDVAYHCIASLFYLSASVLEALATIYMYDGYVYRYYHENISAVVFAYVATLLYVIHAVFSLIRWKSS